MNTMSRWLAPAVMAVGIASMTPFPVHARDDDLIRVLVDVADVVLRGGMPYYRYGDYGYDDRLIVARDRYGRPLYYRQIPRRHADGDRYDGRSGDRHGSQVKCNSNGRCTITYYDPRYDRHRYRYDDRYYGYDDRRW